MQKIRKKMKEPVANGRSEICSGFAKVQSMPMTQTNNHILAGYNTDLMEKVVERSNLKKALKRVESNKGAPGVDNMRVEELRVHLIEHWPSIKQALLEGTYEPAPVRRFEIPKSDGGIRQLGIPTALDRFIQRACNTC